VSLLSVAAALPITGEFMAAVSALGSVDPTSLAVQYLLFRAATFLPLVRFKDRDGVSDRTRDEVAALLLAFPLALSALSQLSWGAAGVYWALRQFQFIGADVAQLVTYGAYHSFLSVQCYIFAGAELFEHGCTNCQGMVKRLALPCVVNFGGAACVACVARGTNYIGTCSYAMPVGVRVHWGRGCALADFVAQVLRAEPVVNREVLEEDEGNNAAVPVDEGNNAAVPVDESVGGGY